MNTTAKTYHAWVLRQTETKTISHSFEALPRQPLKEGQVEIAVQYTSLNYKDALSFSGHPGVTRKFPHVPGVDAAGHVLSARTDSIKEGDAVIVTGYDLGMNTHGGLGEVIVVPAEWVVQKPAGLSLYEAMCLGTAGFTAAQCVQEITRKIKPTQEYPLAVTGATGGVGCLASALLTQLGYSVHAISRKAAVADSAAAVFLKEACGIAAANIHHPDTLLNDPANAKPLSRTRWLSAVDTVGGALLAYLLKSTRTRGVITACGMAAGDEFQTSVFPFILRGIQLSGIDSAACPMQERLQLWQRLATDWKPAGLAQLASSIPLSAAPAELKKFQSGNVLGRIVVAHKSS